MRIKEEKEKREKEIIKSLETKEGRVKLAKELAEQMKENLFWGFVRSPDGSSCSSVKMSDQA